MRCKDENKCKCCNGAGVQMDFHGIRHICPCCNGSGKKRKRRPIILVPPFLW